MEKLILKKQRMYRSTRTVLNKYSQVWKNSIPFKNNVNLFDASYDSMEEKELNQKTSTAASVEKEQVRKNMLDLALIVCGGGQAYSNIIKDKKLNEAFKFAKTSLNHGKEKEVYDRCKHIAATATTITNELDEYNVSAAVLNQFNDAIKDYNKVLNLPHETRKSSKSSKEEMKLLVEECDRILEEVIDNLMLTYKTDQPDFYLEYTNARVIGGWKKKKDAEDTTAA
jgi:hypothetical protein